MMFLATLLLIVSFGVTVYISAIAAELHAKYYKREDTLYIEFAFAFVAVYAAMLAQFYV